METLITLDVAQAAEIIRRGGVCAFPTETVYGLGADVFNTTAIEKIFKAKGRPSDNPLIAHIGEIDLIDELAEEVSETAQKLIEEFFPGPLTLVLPKKSRVPQIATAGLETIGVRMPRHYLAQSFLRECGVPLVAPSANISGRPSPTTWEAVFSDLNGRIDCILKGEMTEIGLESTVVDCTSNVPQLLRAGAVSFEELQQIIPEITVFEPHGDERVKSPGLLHKHYSPRAVVKIVESSFGMNIGREADAFIGLNDCLGFGKRKICKNIDDYAHELFSFFRECDAEDIAEIHCESVEEKGLGRALMDRIRRASEH